MYNIPKSIDKQDITMFMFLGGIIIFYILRMLILFSKKSNMIVKKIFFFFSIILELGLPLYFVIIDFILK